MVRSEQHPANSPSIGQNLGSFFAITPSLLCITGFDGIFQWVNAGFSEVLGYSLSTLMAQSFTDFVHPEDLRATQRAVAKIRHFDKIPITFENRYRGTDGGYRDLVWHAIAQADGIYATAIDITAQRFAEKSLQQEREFSKSILEAVHTLNERTQRETTLFDSHQTLANIQDITERMRAEAAIRRSEEQLRTTTNALPVLIAYIDADERYRFNNRAYEEWLGVPYQTLEGQSLVQALGPNIYNTIQPYLRQALAGQSVTFEVEFPNSDRPYRWVSVSYEPDIQKGQVRGCFALTQDISDRKAADQIKHEFVSVVSHELRTPLTSIHGALKLLNTGQLGKLEDQGQELLEIALNNTERLTRLINDVLDLERIESGRIKMIKVHCQVADLLQQAAQAMMPMAQAQGVTVQVISVDTHIYADSDHVEQTLTNLLSNAIKFSPRGETVVLKAVEQPHQVVFKVIDHGRGIPEDKLETIFERFQQVDASDTRKHGGTGLGLAICREIVQHHNGRIWVTSIHGRGSTFCFTLPKTPTQESPS